MLRIFMQELKQSQNRFWKCLALMPNIYLNYFSQFLLSRCIKFVVVIKLQISLTVIEMIIVVAAQVGCIIFKNALVLYLSNVG